MRLLARIVAALSALLLFGSNLSAQIQVGTSASTAAVDSKGRHWSFFDPGTGQHFAIFYDGSSIKAAYNDSSLSGSWTNLGTVTADDTSDIAVSFKRISTVSYVVLAYAINGDVFLRRGQITSTPSISWGSPVTVFDGSSGVDRYSFPSLAVSGDDFIYVSAIKRKDSGSLANRYRHNVRKSSGTLDGGGASPALDASQAVGREVSRLERGLLARKGASDVYLLSSGDGSNVVAYASNGGAWDEVSSGGDLGWFNFGSDVPPGSIKTIHITPNYIYVGGDFTNLAGIDNADYIARYDINGFAWDDVSTSPLNGPVDHISTDGTDLLVAGNFTDAGGDPDADYVAKLSISGTYQQLGVGGVMGGRVRVVKYDSFGGYYYIGGEFASAGITPQTKGLARTDGSSSWESLDGGLGAGDTGVYAMYIDAMGRVFFGGEFESLSSDPKASYIAFFDGTQINPVIEFPADPAPLAAGSRVNALFPTAGGDMYVGGLFVDADGDSDADNLARFNMSSLEWSYPFTGSFNGEVRAISMDFGGTLAVGGDFTSFNGGEVKRLATESGGTFVEMVSGGASDSVEVLQWQGSFYYIGGKFVRLGGKPGADKLARFGFSTVSAYFDPPVLNGRISASTIWNGKLYLGGSFTDAAGVSLADRIVSWDGEKFGALASETIGDGEVLALHAGSDLYIGGSFLTVGGSIGTRAYVMKYDGSAFDEIAASGGPNGPVNAITSFGTMLIVGGSFSTPHAYVSSFEDDAWSPMGSGFTGPVHALTADTFSLYAGGSFSQAVGVPGTQRIARWNGTSWTTVGSSNQLPNGTIYALALEDSDLYIGGDFQDASGDLAVDNFAKLSGSSFVAVDGGVDGTVRAIQVSGDTLYVGGDFTAADGLPDTSGVASFDVLLGNWSAVAKGIDGSVRTLAYDSSSEILHAAGDFSQADGNPTNNYSYARKAALANVDLNVEVSAIGDGEGNLNILASDRGGKLVYRQYVLGSSQWDTAVELQAAVKRPIVSANELAKEYFAFFFKDAEPASIERLVKKNGQLWPLASTPVVLSASDPHSYTAHPNPGLGKMPVIFAMGSSAPYDLKSTHVDDRSDLRGRITNSSSAGIGGVSVLATGIGITTTDILGDFNLGPVDNGLAYSVSLSKFGYSFLPNPITGNHDGSDLSSTGTLTSTHTISGQIATSGMVPISGVLVNGGSLGNRTTDSNGNYQFDNVPTSTMYSVVPSLAGYAFSPTSAGGTLASNAVHNFVGTATGGRKLYGIVKRLFNAQPLQGVTVNGGALGNITTDNNGYFEFASVTPGTNYSLDFGSSGFAFPDEPITGTMGSVDLDLGTIDGVMLVSVSGNVKHLGLGLAGVAISSGTLGNTSTDAMGDFAYSNVLEGTNHTLTPGLPGYRFLPVSANVTAGQGGTLVFDAIRVFSLTIHVEKSATPLQGVSVNGGSLGSGSTNSAGDLAFTNVDEGTNYSVSLSKLGYRFDINPVTGTLNGNATRNVQGIQVFDISGTITHAGSFLSGVTISGGTLGNRTTNASGFYLYDDIDENTGYTLIPSLANYRFTPVSAGGSLAGSVSHNFTATRLYKIGGQITHKGSPLAGVNVSVGAFNDVTDSSGNYELPGIDENANFNIMLSKPGFRFNGSASGTLTGDTTRNFMAVRLYKVSGIITHSGSPLAGVTVNGGAIGSATSDATGSYEITNVDEDSVYTIVPQRAGYRFTPPSAAGVLTGDALRNFAAVRLYQLSGKVTYKGAPLAGVSVSAAGGNGITDANGDYLIGNIDEGANYTITLGKAGFRFTGSNTGTLSSDTIRNFSAIARFEISGTVRHAGSPLPGVTVDGGALGSATTDSAGAYSFADVDEGTSYVITPQLANFRFNPVSVSSALTANASHDFTAIRLYRITGQVTRKGNPLQGVSVSIGSSSGTTDGAGNYIVAGVDEGTRYILTLTKTGFSFSGATTGVLTGDQVRNFTASALYNISGRISLAGSGLAGVTLNGGPLGSASSDANGNYMFANVSEDSSYSIVPSLNGYDITPASAAGIVTAHRTHDFTATLQAGTISGTILRNGSGLAGVAVAFSAAGGPRNSTSDASGRYTFTGVEQGIAYTITASIAGHTITPSSVSATMGTTAVHDFTAVIRTFDVSGLVLLNGEPLQGATVDGGSLGSQITDQNGAFLFASVPYNTDCRLTASMPGFIFDVPWSGTIMANVTSVRLTGASVLSPLLTCVRAEGGGAYTAFFGYRSISQSNLRVEIGRHNRFLPGQQNMGQVVDFIAGPGSVSNAFAVLFDGSPITWELAGGAVMASSASTPCAIPGGGCPGGQRPDRCGVCNGNGMSCLSCSITDLSDLHESILESVRKIRSFVKRGTARLPGAAARSGSSAETQQRIERLIESLNAMNMSCSRSDYCTDLDRSAPLRGLEQARRELAGQVQDTVQDLRRSGQQLEAGRMRRITKRLLKQLSQDIASLPRYHSDCEGV